MRNPKKKAAYPERVRIIGGHLGGRYVSVLSANGLRPTPERVRETLFNWLQAAIAHAHVLDVFSGTGVLAFEAMSRGAQSATLIEFDLNAAQQLLKLKMEFKLDQVEVIHGDALSILNKTKKRFDIVFLDPPFANDLLLYQAIQALELQELLAPKSLIYIESGSPLVVEKLPENWEIKKSKKAGKVFYYLISMKSF